MEQMIDNMIMIGAPQTALKMEWILLAYSQNGDVDAAFMNMFKLQKETL